ncbi:hypothetical protein R3P38DRAFT_2446719, partial [Favolaschia claudopus]
IPLEYVRAKSTFLKTLDFHNSIPQPYGQPMKQEKVPFFSLIQTDPLFQSVSTNFAKLPTRSSAWSSPVSPWNVFTDVKDLPLPDVHVVETPDVFVKTPSPVTAKTTEAFTEEARLDAEKCDTAFDLEDLEEMIADRSRTRYIEINTSILDGKVLRIQDPTGKLLSDVFTLPPPLYDKMKDSIALVQGAMPGEWKEDESDRDGYRFLSCHYSYYSRYGEQGHDAPKDAPHMDNAQRDHGGRINFTQRIPHLSKEIRETPREYSILCDAYEEVFDYIRVTLQARFPDEYKNLSIYCDVLPMNAASPCYPF